MIVAAAVAMIACEGIEEDRPLDAREGALVEAMSLPSRPPASPDNPWADDPKAAELGRALFFDDALGADGATSCATCHDPKRRFTDGLVHPAGDLGQGRRTPSLVGASHQAFFGWEGSTDSLWSQALLPLEGPEEMDTPRTDLAKAVATRHRARYEATFGALPELSDARRFPRGATPHEGHPTERKNAWASMSERDRDVIDTIFANVGRALEAYERRLEFSPSPFDRYVEARQRGDPAAEALLSPEARIGLRLFLGPGRCVHCHSGALLSDREFHNLGLPEVGREAHDPGGRTTGLLRLLGNPFRCGGPKSSITRDGCATRYLDPSFPDFVGAFRTPSLRNAAANPPFMHGGQLGSLEEVIAFYRSRPGRPTRGHRDLLLDGIPRTLPVRPLVTFLKSLVGVPPPESIESPFVRERDARD